MEQDKQSQPNDSEKKSTEEVSVTNSPTPTVFNAPAQSPVIVKQGSGKGIAAVSLLFSLVALGCSGLLFVQGQNVLENAKRDYNVQLDKAALGQSDNARLLGTTIEAQQALESRYNQLNDSVRKFQEQLDTTNQNYQNLSDNRLQWLVNETEYTLNTMMQQLLFNGNAQASLDTLSALEKRLNRFDMPELLPLKKAVSADLAAMKAQPATDIVAASLRLDRLLADADNLPLLVDAMLQDSVPQIQAIPTENAWYENIWQGVKNNMGNLVTVRKIGDPGAMTVSPEQLYFIRQNIKLRLLDARLALTERSSEIYQNDLNAVANEVNRYFDISSPAVKVWLSELDSLKSLDIRPAQLDILKNSLATIRQYQQRNDDAQIAQSAGKVDSKPDSKADIAIPADLSKLPMTNPALNNDMAKDVAKDATKETSEEKASSESVAKPDNVKEGKK